MGILSRVSVDITLRLFKCIALWSTPFDRPELTKEEANSAIPFGHSWVTRHPVNETDLWQNCEPFSTPVPQMDDYFILFSTLPGAPVW